MKKINSMLERALPFLAGVLFFVWISTNWQALSSLHRRWIRFDELYAIGYPALIAASWWLWRHRAAIKRSNWTPSVSALLALSAVVLTGAAAQLVQLTLIQQFAALGSLLLIAVTLLGWRSCRLFAFPVAIMLLVIPFWDFMAYPLRTMTVWFTQHMLDLLRIPAHIDGFLIHLPTGTIEVADGCSGLNLFLAMLLIGLLFVESLPAAWPRKIAAIVLAGAIGIVDNWLRVFLLVVIAHVSEMQSGLVRHHGSFGWWIYALGLLPYFVLARRIERGGKPGAAREFIVASPTRPTSRARVSIFMIAIAAVMLAVAAGVKHLEHRRGALAAGFAPPVNAVPIAIGAAWLPRYAGQDVTQTWRVFKEGIAYDIAALTYLEQRENKKLIYFSNRIADEREVQTAGQLQVKPGFTVNTALIHASEWRLVWWFWWVDGATSTSALKTKLLQLKAALIGDPSAALIAVTVVCPDEECAQTSARTQNIAQLLEGIRDPQPPR